MDRASSQFTQSSLDPLSSLTRRPTDSTLEFVFEENPRLGMAPEEGVNMSGQPTTTTFSPVGIPEDVESSRASSPLEHHVEDIQDNEIG